MHLPIVNYPTVDLRGGVVYYDFTLSIQLGLGAVITSLERSRNDKK